MSFERPQSKNEVRANTVMQLIRAGKCKSVPEAIRHVLRNEMITHEPDVERIMSEIGTLLQQRRQLEDEDDIHRQIQEEEMLVGAEETRLQRSGDPED